MKQLYLLFFLLFISIASQAQMVTYSNTTPIIIEDNTIASVYSSDIVVSGFTGTINDVGVVIRNFTHGAPSDVAICLEAPSGDKMLVQEALWGAPANNISYMMSDLGVTQIGIWDLPADGTYKPTANSALVSFNSPGPGMGYSNPGPAASGSATMASVFGGTTANGTWKLWIVDISGGDAGTINGGWELVINPNTVLPVDLADFKTSCETNNVLNVSWTTYNEQNSKDFTIQVSPDGSFFEDAKTINASGNSQIEMTYKASIVMPYAKTYVRLKLSDLNGQATYSEVLEAKCGDGLPIAVSPNPILNNYFVIDNPSGELLQFELTDIKGKLITKGTSKSVHYRVELDEHLMNGIYLLRVKSKNGESDFKLNKQ